MGGGEREQRVVNYLEKAQAFLQSYDSAPRPTPFVPFSRQQVFSLFLIIPVSSVEVTDGRGGEERVRGAKSYDREKAWSSINHSILSGRGCFLSW